MNATQIIAETTDIPKIIEVPAGSFPVSLRSLIIVDRDGKRAIDETNSVFRQVSPGLMSGTVLADGATFVGEYAVVDLPELQELVILNDWPCTTYSWCIGHGIHTTNRHSDEGQVITAGPLTMQFCRVIEDGEERCEWWCEDVDVKSGTLADIARLPHQMAELAGHAIAILSTDPEPTAHNAGSTEITIGVVDGKDHTVVIYTESEDGTAAITDAMSPDEARRRARALIEQADIIDENAGR